MHVLTWKLDLGQTSVALAHTLFSILLINIIYKCKPPHTVKCQCHISQPFQWQCHDILFGLKFNLVPQLVNY